MPCTCRPRTVVLDGLLDEHGALFEYPGHVSGVRSVFCDREWRGSLVAIDNRVRSALIAPMRFGASTRSNCLYHRQTKRPFERSQVPRSEEHTSELQSLMRISYAVFCLKKKNKHKKIHTYLHLRKIELITH